MTKPKKTKEPTKKLIAQFVRGQGTDEEIFARCAAEIDGWDGLGAREQADMVRIMRTHEALPVSPIMTLRKNEDVTTLSPPPGANVSLNAARLTDTFASGSQALCDQRLSDLYRYSAIAGRGDDGEHLSAGIAFVSGARPEDTVQSALAVQMAETHDAAIWALTRARSAEMVPQLQMFGNLATKLLNAYTRQAETLAKLQRGGEQIVKHIHIDNRGGQAVVTDQVVTGGSEQERPEQPYAPNAISPALLGSDPFGRGVPMSCDQRQEALPSARRTINRRA